MTKALQSEAGSTFFNGCMSVRNFGAREEAERFVGHDETTRPVLRGLRAAILDSSHLVNAWKIRRARGWPSS